MRHVDTSGLTTSSAWADKTKSTLDQVRDAMASAQERTFTPHWTDDEIRKPLLALVGEKCWYCETTIQRADINVDHFRPKSAVLGENGHDGYWWLAYRIDNYRLACKQCNSGGARFDGMREGRAKGTRFPLLAGVRARKEGDDLDLEQPLLLDPARHGDPDLIGFDASGFARRSNIPYSPDEERGDICRTDETIRILALNAGQITDQRRDLMLEFKTLVPLEGAPGVQELIAKKVSPTAQWSAAAATALNLYRALAMPVNASTQTTGAIPTPAPVSSSARVDLKGLLKYLDPVELAAGITLTGRRGKRILQATLDSEGKIELPGQKRKWGTPTTAARLAIGIGGEDVNGWDFWKLTIAGVPQSLAEFRDVHEPPSAPA